jgi:hypothetical protein
MKPILTILLFSLLSLVSQAQQATPSWVKMMEDPNVNYYEAVKSFEQFWKGRDLPMEEEELLNENITREEKREHRREERKLKHMTPSQRQEYDYLSYQYKRFNNWRHEMKQYVQEDGHILSQEERNKMFEQQQQEINNRKH